MPAITTFVAVAGLVIGGASAYQSFKAQESAGQARDDARREQQKQAVAANREQRITQVRRARQASARTRQQATSIGAATSTSASAAATSPFTRVASSFGFQNTQIASQRRVGEFLSTATEFENRALRAEAIGGLGDIAFKAAGGFDRIFA